MRNTRSEHSVALLGMVLLTACGSGGDSSDDSGVSSAGGDSGSQGSDCGGPACVREPRSVDRLLVTGVCRSPGSRDFGEIDLSWQLSSSTEASANGHIGLDTLTPSDLVSSSGGPRPVSEVLHPADFTFALSSSCDRELDATRFQACAEPMDATGRQTGQQTGIALSPQAVRYEAPGGPTRASDDRLIVLLLDNSGSLMGQADPLARPDEAKASDPSDARLDFLRRLVRRPSVHSEGNTYYSLVWFDRRDVHVTPEFGTPTRNLDVLACPDGSTGAACQADPALDGLSRLADAEGGATPLAEALDQTYRLLIDGDATRALNPVVVLFTDGVEGGDSSDAGKTIAQVTERYAQHHSKGEWTPVPVIVLHLQPSAASGFLLGRDPDLYALACATGGEYFFIEHAEALTTNRVLEGLVAARLAGTWKLRSSSTETAGLDAGVYRLASEVTLSVGDERLTTRLGGSGDPAADDALLWFVR